MTKEIFEEQAPLYINASYNPLPIEYGGKGCKITNWNKLYSQLPEGTLEKRIEQYGHCGIGLLMGSRFPDGTTLGALDIDHDDYVDPIKFFLGNPPCGRFGSKGIAYFVRVQGLDLARRKNPKFKVQGPLTEKYGQVCECFFEKTQVVIPPTIHPNTKRPYEWVGKPLLETDYKELPIIEVA